MKLSIITINYNNITGLRKTINSIISQTWRDFEWIIIDGGSTDGSKELIEQTASNSSSNISYWCSERDKGIYNAMNKGIIRAKGDYLNFMNSGDCFYENMTLKEVETYLENRSADVLYGDCLIVEDNKIIETRQFHSPFDLFDLYYLKLSHQSTFFRKELFNQSGYDESYKIAADHAKNMEFMYAGHSFQHINNIVATYDNTGLSSNPNQPTGEEFKRISNEMVPPYIMRVLSRLYRYEEGHIYKRVNKILDKGGIKSFILQLYLKLLE